jgi:hypothetical protein
VKKQIALQFIRALNGGNKNGFKNMSRSRVEKRNQGKTGRIGLDLLRSEKK